MIVGLCRPCPSLQTADGDLTFTFKKVDTRTLSKRKSFLQGSLLSKRDETVSIKVKRSLHWVAISSGSRNMIATLSRVDSITLYHATIIAAKSNLLDARLSGDH